jgi:hypothetical protein
MAKAVTLVHPNATLQVLALLLVHKCDLFSDDPGLAAFPYQLKSQVSLSDFQQFVSALEGTTVTVTNNNFKGLFELCEEFRFRELRAQLSQFQESGNSPENSVLLSALNERILAMEKEIQNGKQEIVSLRRELSQVQELLEQRIRTEAESTSHRTNEVEKSVAEVRSEVANVSKAFREVRELAEGTQKKAESTEEQLAWVRLAVALSTRETASIEDIRREVDDLRKALRESAEATGWNSVIVRDFPTLFDDFKKKKFTLLLRGSRDGFRAGEFHSRCNGHPNTLTVILDTDGNIFGGFTPVEWESRAWNGKYDGANNCWKADMSQKSFLFTLKNPHNLPARRFALKAEAMHRAIVCNSDWGPHLYDILVVNNCDANTDSYTSRFGSTYGNDTGEDGETFFTGSQQFRVREIEVFEITN